MPMIEFTVVAEKLFVDDELSMDGLELLATLVAQADNGRLKLTETTKIRDRGTWEDVHFDELLEELIEHGYVRCYLPTERESELRKWRVQPINNVQAA